ncbi:MULTISPECIES: hypothetical protein [unclassified Kitasatospora]|uniref:hypothetical protein n=1 Tax=unclassified Kitasatospora TaxID=2633591 RepID=UPI001F347281|nr:MULTISPECIES: hypothetical protein [unclassified Kitasatospora]
MSENDAAAPGADRELIELLHRRFDRIEGLLDPGFESADERPAWRRPTDGEERWAVTLAILTAVALQLVLPDRLTIEPHWLLPGLEIALLLALAAIHPHRRLNRSSYALRGLGLSLVAAISLANGWSAVKLVRELLHGTGPSGALALLGTAGAVWVTNVIAFALWYWEWDRGGPAARAEGTKDYPDFLFPQMQQQGIAAPDWQPYFGDYLYVAFTNATAFSPTDTMPLNLWVKLLMMTQAAVSMIIVLLVVARAVGILQ